MLVRRRLASVLLLAAVAGSGSGCAHGNEPLFMIDDAELAHDVDARLSADAELPVDRIHVEVADRTVRLSGVVAEEQERQRAAAIALHTRGVRAVVNRIDVAEPSL